MEEAGGAADEGDDADSGDDLSSGHSAQAGSPSRRPARARTHSQRTSLEPSGATPERRLQRVDRRGAHPSDNADWRKTISARRCALRISGCCV